MKNPKRMLMDLLVQLSEDVRMLFVSWPYPPSYTVVLNFNRCLTHCDQLCLHSRAFIKPWVRKAHFYMHYNGCQSIMSVYFWAPSAIPCIYRICRQRLKLCLGFAAYFGLSPCNVLLGGKILHVILDQRSFFAALISSTCATTIENPLSSTHSAASYASTVNMWGQYRRSLPHSHIVV